MLIHVAKRISGSDRRKHCFLRQAVVHAAAAVLLLSHVVSAGSISYPALGNVELEQGTIEMWIIPQVSLTEGDLAQRKFWSFNLFEIRQDEDNFMSVIWRSLDGRNGPFARHRQEGFKIPVNWYVVEDWQQGEAHHVAYCWDRGTDWWIVDGVKTERKPSQYGRLDLHFHERLQMVVGSAAMQGVFVIDDLRISSIPRQEHEVGYHYPGKLEPDFWTLLLDTFDDPFECDGDQQTTPAVMMPSASGESGGIPSDNCKFVPGVSGTGLEL